MSVRGCELRAGRGVRHLSQPAVNALEKTINGKDMMGMTGI